MSTACSIGICLWGITKFVVQIVIYQALMIFIIIVVKMMEAGVLPFNTVVACFYLATIGVLLLVLKKANKPLKRYQPKHPSPSSKEQKLDFDKITAIAYLKKYTLPGSCLFGDKKYLLKEFLFIATYSVSCININHIIIWPVSLSLVLLTITFLLWDVTLKMIETKIKESNENKINVEQIRGESELEIASDSLEPRVHVIPVVDLTQPAKLKIKAQRNVVQTGMITGVCFVCLVMIFKTVMTLSTSISNSGELNIISLLAIIAIDQFGVRIGVGITVWTGCKIMNDVAKNNNQQPWQFILLLCQEEITDIRIEAEEERLRKQREMVASPPRKKNISPSRIPKALLSAQRQTYLNLINLQPTNRNQEQALEQIILTSAEKDMFGDSIDDKNGFYTKRLRNRENRDVASQSANKGTTIDFNQKKEPQDFIVLKDDPFNEIENIASGQFFLDDSDIRRTKRRNIQRRKNKRNLKLTGNSPYLEYLPDMLKKVDQFKHFNKNDKDKEAKQKEKDVKML